MTIKSPVRVTITNKEEELREYLEHLLDRTKVPFSIFDLETTSLRIDANIICASFYDHVRNPFVPYTDAVFEDGIPEDRFIAILAEYMPRLRVAGHNIKYDLGVLKQNGIGDPEIEVDTLLMCHVWDPDQLKNLETRVHKDLGYAKQTFKQIIGKGWDKIDWKKDVRSTVNKAGEVVPPLITPQNLGTYAGEDAYWTGKLKQYYDEKLTRPLRKILEEVEMPLMWMLRDMHHYGVRVDPTVLIPLDKELEELIRLKQEEVYDVAGKVFNLNSPKQMAEVLYDKIGIPPIKMTKTGARSTDSPTLKVYAEDGWEIAQHLVDYSAYETLKTNYTSKIPRLIDMDGRLRGSFNQAATGTSRFSSSEPNLQNLPARTQMGLQVREAFIPTEGWLMWAADMSQIEPRIAAHLSEDPDLIRIYHSHGDIYIGIAEALGISRDDAKIVLLAIFYGLGARKLARSIRRDVREAKEIIAGVYRKYPVFAKWKERVEYCIKRDKYIINMFGQIRRFPNARPDAGDEAYFGSLRAGFNAMIQSSAAIMLKIAMRNSYQRMTKELSMESRILLTVHDELVGESPRLECEEALNIVVDCMENSVKLKVPVIAEKKIIHNWSQMKIKTFKGIDLHPSRKISPVLLFHR